MANSMGSRLRHAWSVFKSGETSPLTSYPYVDRGYGYASKPDRIRLQRGNERSIVSALYNRIAIDVASIDIRHVRLDQNNRYVSTMNSELNQRLAMDANKDQPARAFIQDVVMSMFDEGCVAIVPVDTLSTPKMSGSFDILSWRTGKIIEWYPDEVRIRLYNDKIGKEAEVNVPKSFVAIIENPLYAVMNEQNSTLQRLIRKLNLLDLIDEQSSSGKLDIIIQLPYMLKTEAKRDQAERRRIDMERQLKDSKYGVAYADATEKIVQLNRPAENNLLAQITYLTNMVYGQLGLPEGIFNGTADESAMLNYHSRTIEPVISAIIDEIQIKFLTKTARSQGQSVMFFRDPFKLVPVNEIANIADKFTRNEILSSNELRAVIGYKPSDDPRADELRNKNLNASNDQLTDQAQKEPDTQDERENQNE